MDFWGTVLTVFRRWYVVLPVFGATVAAAFGIYSTVPTYYVSSAVLALTLPPSGGSLPTHADSPNPLTNPLLNFDHGLSVSASIIIAALNTSDTSRELGVLEDSDTDYEVSNGENNLESLATGPLVFIQGESLTPEGARDIVARLIAKANEELVDRQKGLKAPAATYITTYEAVPPTKPEAQKGRKLRAVLVALAVGAIASLCAAFAVDSMAAARRRRRASRASAEPVLGVPRARQRADEPAMRR
ncbi:hypothetical protein [Acrocarpospora sp. B8E8]|uniref:hypothetical protein n=1 Tax=Acrocarpospora sp. B8E8 TaxID=3153572 RepID=UPI00325F0B0F